VQCLGVRLAGDVIDEVDENGEPIVGDSLVYLLNAAPTSIEFTLTAFVEQPRWERLIDTYDAGGEGQTFVGGYRYPLGDRSVVVFRMPNASLVPCLLTPPRCPDRCPLSCSITPGRRSVRRTATAPHGVKYESRAKADENSQ
jgi:hypothetical protein